MTSRPEMGGFLFEEGREPETWAGPTAASMFWWAAPVLARAMPEGLRHVGDQVRKEMCLTPVISSTNFMCVEAIPPRQNAEWQQQI